MKLPRGFGSVSKLNDKRRRRPWIIRKSGKVIGYASTKKEAMEILTEFNKTPWDPKKKKMTFSEVFCLLLEKVEGNLSPHTIKNYHSQFKNHCKDLYNVPYSELKTYHFSSVIDTCDGNNGTKNNIRKLFRAMDKVAYEYDIIDKQYSEFIPPLPRENKNERKPFTEEEIELLWDNLEMQDVDLVLIHIYTGVRPGELVSIKIDDINLNERYMRCGIKTEFSRNRIVPLHSKIIPLIKKRMDICYSKTFLPYGDKAYRNRFKKVMEKLELRHIPHECRHTLRTRLDNANANATCIDFILGHTPKGTGARVYTHKKIDQLIETIDLLK